MANDATVCVTGNLTRDPTHSVTDKGFVLSFTIAANTKMKKEDNSGYEANYFNVSLWGKPGEWLMDKLQKGTMVEVHGDLFLKRYERKNPTQDEGRYGYSMNIEAHKVIPRSRMKSGRSQQQSMDPEPGGSMPF